MLWADNPVVWFEGESGQLKIKVLSTLTRGTRGLCLPCLAKLSTASTQQRLGRGYKVVSVAVSTTNIGEDQGWTKEREISTERPSE